MPTAIQNLSSRDSYETARNVDQAERDAIEFGIAPVEEGVRDDVIAQTHLIDELPEQIDEINIGESDLHRDEISSIALSEATRRASILGPAYPFTVQDGQLHYRRCRTICYEFCLAVCMAEQITKGNFVKLPREFERFTSRVAAARLGDGAGHLRFGWPTDDDDPERLPTNFRERIDYLRQTGGYADTEWQLKPNTIEELEEIISASNDGHIDVVVWRAFQDQRPGFISWIGQCSCGRTDVLEKEKWSELDYKWLNEILFETSTLVPPRLFYSTPHHIPTDIQLKQMHRFTGLTFDRSRLCLLAESHPEIHREHAEHMTSLIRLVIQNFQAE